MPGLRALGVTGREFEVLRLVADGSTNADVAARLHLSPGAGRAAGPAHGAVRRSRPSAERPRRVLHDDETSPARGPAP
ncbi:LuxR C-terminal-related transcriptional regulator [Pseudonocardia sp. C8]|uniref:LuxR C-terminal-related transcriptional regulator n=1 Tax=Pseudonocardia sp. C8 TaxID=2762759 RepID=UPI001C930CE7|nr:LuxR C-terminal-related transcriptional regulator [Pseudonocardia sp. C8]